MSNLTFTVFPALFAIAVTATCFLGFNALSGGSRPLLAAILAALIVPILLLALALWLLFSPNPHHYDGPGMGFAALVMLALFALPLCFATSSVAFAVRSKVRRR